MSLGSRSVCRERSFDCRIIPLRKCPNLVSDIIPASTGRVLPIDPPRFVAFEKMVASSVGCSSPFSKGTDQFFSSCLIRLSNSSNEIAPLILSALMKKVGVAVTFSTLCANSSSADSLSNRA
jgi:hypothetical protein